MTSIAKARKEAEGFQVAGGLPTASPSRYGRALYTSPLWRCRHSVMRSHALICFVSFSGSAFSRVRAYAPAAGVRSPDGFAGFSTMRTS
jgi:hypothetical protein